MVEKNIVFILPLAPKLQALKEELESDESFMIFEVDALNEYGQIIGVLEQSVTFSSDLKKTKSYLHDFSKFVKTKTARNYLVMDSGLAPHIFSNLQSKGLNEVFQESSSLKTFKRKIDIFFGDKTDQDAMNKPMIADNKEGLFDFDGKKRKSFKKNDFSHFSNFTLKKNRTDMSFLNNNLSHYQRKKIPVFLPQLQNMDLKRVNFEPLGQELKNNPYGKSLEVTPTVSKKKNGSFEEAELKKLNKNKFIPVEKELSKLKRKFDEVIGEQKGGKSGKLDFPEAEEKPRMQAQLNEIERKKKSKKFEEVEKEASKKNGKLDFPDKEVNTRSLAKVEEIEREKKNKKFEEVEKEALKKNGELNFPDKEVNPRSQPNLEEIEREKKNKHFEEVEKESSKKNGKLDFPDREINPRSQPHLEEIEREKKNKHFEEVEKESSKKSGKLELPKRDKDKRLTTEAIEKKNSISKQAKNEQPGLEEYELILNYTKDRKVGVESTLDYRKLRAEFKEGKLQASKELTDKIIKRGYDEIAKIEDSPLFPFDSYGLEYFVAYLDLVWICSDEPLKLLKFVHFSLQKEFGADVLFYRKEQDGVKVLYQGINLDSDQLERLESQKKNTWDESKLPTWSDETFQEKELEFIYPFFEEGEFLGYMVGFFHKTVSSRQQAQAVELLTTMAKGVYFENSLL